MKEILMKILKEYADNQANLSSQAFREKLSIDILNVLQPDSRDLANKNQLNLFGDEEI